jgi:hypothetical protein
MLRNVDWIALGHKTGFTVGPTCGCDCVTPETLLILPLAT